MGTNSTPRRGGNEAAGRIRGNNGMAYNPAQKHASLTLMGPPPGGETTQCGCYSFIYVLFNDDESISGYIAANDSSIRE